MKAKISLPPLIRWPGGQSRDAKLIARYLGEHSTYVEPFAGGLSVFFAKKPAETEVIGDLDRWLVDFYQRVRLGGLRKCRGGFRVNRKTFEKAKRSGSSLKGSACMKMALSTISYDGNRVNYGPSGREGLIAGRSKLKKLASYEHRLRRSILRRSTFEDTMRAYDGPDTLHFLDPPWNIDYAEVMYLGGNRRQKSKLPQSMKGREAFDPAHVRKVADSMEGQVVVIYKDHPAVRKAFAGRKGWQGFRIESTRGANIHGARPIRKLIFFKKARPKRRSR